jgi:hypothetical protein
MQNIAFLTENTEGEAPTVMIILKLKHGTEA